MARQNPGWAARRAAAAAAAARARQQQDLGSFALSSGGRSDPRSRSSKILGCVETKNKRKCETSIGRLAFMPACKLRAVFGWCGRASGGECFTGSAISRLFVVLNCLDSDSSNHPCIQSIALRKSMTNTHGLSVFHGIFNSTKLQTPVTTLLSPVDSQTP